MIESVGTKFFKSITETADDLGSRFEIAFTNFSNKIAGLLIGSNLIKFCLFNFIFQFILREDVI